MAKLTFQKNSILGVVKHVKSFTSALSVSLAVANEKKGYDTIPVMLFGRCIDQFNSAQIGDLVYVEGRLHINHNKNTNSFNLELVAEKVIATGDRCNDEELAMIMAKKGGYANGAGNGGQPRQYKQYQPKNTANGGGQPQPQGNGNNQPRQTYAGNGGQPQTAGNSGYYNQPQGGNGYGSQPRQPRQYGYGTQPQGGNGYNQAQNGYNQPGYHPQGGYYQPYGNGYNGSHPQVGNTYSQPQDYGDQPQPQADQKGGSFPEYNGNFQDVYYDIPDDDQ